MNDELHIITTIGDKVLEKQVDKGYDIVDGIFTKSHTIVVAICRCLVGHYHCSAIALWSYFIFDLSNLFIKALL